MPPPPSPSPCDGLPTPTEVTFYYDREAAAHYAIIHSLSHASGVIPPVEDPNDPNITPTSPLYLDDGHLVGRVTSDLRGQDDIPFADFAYKRGNLYTGTSSARFTSEVIWMGGMPMNLENDIGAICLTHQEGQGVIPTSDWYYCPNTPNSQGIGAKGWVNHQDIGILDRLPFTRVGVIPADSTRAEQQQLEEERDDIALDYQARFVRNLIDIPGILFNSSVPELMSGLLEVNQAELLKRGDYIFINNTDNSTLRHGVIVVGWGEPKDCDDAIDHVLDRTVSAPPLGITIPQLFDTSDEAQRNSIQYPVPYISDFSGWIGAQGQNTDSTPLAQIQSPAPRPFYCTVFSGDGSHPNFPFGEGAANLAFGWYNWELYSIDDQFTISIEEFQAYANNAPTWTWAWSGSNIPSGIYDARES